STTARRRATAAPSSRRTTRTSRACAESRPSPPQLRSTAPERGMAPARTVTTSALPGRRMRATARRVTRQRSGRPLRRTARLGERRPHEGRYLGPGPPCQSRDPRRAQLWLARDNPRALRFYERNAFAPDGVENAGSGFGGIRAVRPV